MSSARMTGAVNVIRTKYFFRSDDRNMSLKTPHTVFSYGIRSGNNYPPLLIYWRAKELIRNGHIQKLSENQNFQYFRGRLAAGDMNADEINSISHECPGNIP